VDELRWHARSARELIGSLGATVHSPESDNEDEALGASYRAGDVLPGGVETKDGLYPGEAVLWIPEDGALVAGDLLIDRPEGLQVPPESWLPEGMTREALRESLRPLLKLHVELVLPTHGEPIANGARPALEQAVQS
jgi:glyoxylase-like metal-dependent hydrolase (beta-lactamase superfamily II)